MKKGQILLCIFAAWASDAMADMPVKKTFDDIIPKKKDAIDQASDPVVEKAVDEALQAIKKNSPQVHEDSLRVWKNFSSKSKPVNYTYRFWGRSLILWLKDQKKMTFQSEEQVGEVFKVLWRKGLISQNAVVVLMVDAWSHLIYLEGAPSWEKGVENRSPQGGTTSNSSVQSKPRERDV
jgi:hypothetical protein